MIVAEIEVPVWMVGKHLEELELRSRYNVSVFIVKELHEHGEPRLITPNAGYVFRAGDILLVGGINRDIEAIKEKV